MGRAMKYLFVGIGGMLDMAPRANPPASRRLQETRNAINARSPLGTLGRDFEMVGNDLRAAIARYTRGRKAA